MKLDAAVRRLLEWLQNKRSESWDLAEVDARLHKKMGSANERARDTIRAYAIAWPTVAYFVAPNRLAGVHRDRGIFP